MKILTTLAPVLNLLKNISFIYRLIGVGIGFMLFSGSFKDALFLSSSQGATPITIEELMAIPQGEIPRYLKLKNVALMSDLYVATQNEDTGSILDASYPVYSTSQFGSGAIDAVAMPAQVIIKDKDFDENAILAIEGTVDGMYDNESFGEVRGILEANGVKVANNAVLIVKDVPPSMGSSILIALVTGLLSLLIVLSFVPAKYLGKEVVVQEEGEAA